MVKQRVLDSLNTLHAANLQHADQKHVPAVALAGRFRRELCDAHAGSLTRAQGCRQWTRRSRESLATLAELWRISALMCALGKRFAGRGAGLADCCYRGNASK